MEEASWRRHDIMERASGRRNNGNGTREEAPLKEHHGEAYWRRHHRRDMHHGRGIRQQVSWRGHHEASWRWHMGGA